VDLNVPLRESLVAANMSPLTGFAAVARFGVTLARGAAAWTDHFGLLEGLKKVWD
jgi:hypothetical protein